MTLLQLSGITKRFGKTTVLDDVSLTVRSGEYLVLLGASGCGKTTLLNIIAGLVPPDVGEVLIDGNPVNAIPPRKRDLSMAFQSDCLYPHMTIRDSLTAGLSRGVSKSERQSRVDEAAKMLELPDELLDRVPSQLSGGQQRRAAIAKTIVSGAPLRLLDEPLAALDNRVRFSIQTTIRRQHTEHPVTTVHVTHDSDEAMRLADRIAVIGERRILQVGTPEEIYRRPNCQAVAESVGIPPINIIDVPCDALPNGFTPGGSGEFATIGLRPGAIEIVLRTENRTSEATSSALCFDGNVVGVTFVDETSMGCTHEIQVQLNRPSAAIGSSHQRADNKVIVARQLRASPQPLAIGDEVQLCIDVADVLIFRPQNSTV